MFALKKEGSERESTSKQAYKDLSEQKEKIEKMLNKQVAEHKKLLGDMDFTRKEIPKLKETIESLTNETKRLKDPKPINDLNKQIGELNKRIKDQQTILANKEKQLKELKEKGDRPLVKVKQVQEPVGLQTEDFLKMLKTDQKLRSDAMDLLGMQKANETGKPASLTGQGMKLPIRREANILDSDEQYPEEQEIYYGINFDVEEEEEKKLLQFPSQLKQVRSKGDRLEVAEPVEMVVVPDLEGKKRISRAVINSLPDDHRFHKVAELWQSIYHYELKTKPDEVKNPLKEWRETLEQLDRDFEPQSVVAMVNKAINLFNRSDREGVANTCDEIEQYFWNKMYNFLPKYLEDIRMSENVSLKVNNLISNDGKLLRGDKDKEAEILKENNRKLKEENGNLYKQMGKLEDVIK